MTDTSTLSQGWAGFPRPSFEQHLDPLRPWSGAGLPSASAGTAINAQATLSRVWALQTGAHEQCAFGPSVMHPLERSIRARGRASVAGQPEARIISR